MESVQSIVDTILKHVETLPHEDIPLVKSVGRIAGKEIIAHDNFPGATIALVDGYAIRSEWIRDVSPQNPAQFAVISKNAREKIDPPHTALLVQLMEHIPEKYDVVIPKDEASVSHGILTIRHPLEKWENVLPLGASIQKGSVLLARGDEITYSDVGRASYLGLETLPVIRKARVALVLVCSAQGVEDHAIMAKYLRGISSTLSAQILKYQGIFKSYRISSDLTKEDKATLVRALRNDMMLVVAQISLKNRQGLRNTLRDLNIHLRLQTENVHPGHFFCFGTKGKKLIFFIPNDPVGAVLNFEEFVRPALFRMQGKKRIQHSEINARLRRALFNIEGKINLIQAFVQLKNGVFYAIPIERGPIIGLDRLHTMNGIIVLSENMKQIPTGSVARVHMLCQPEWNF